MGALHMRTKLGLAALVIVAIVVGVAAAKPVALHVARHLAVHDGPWQTWAGTGSSHANIYTRAAVALAGLYALTPREAIYYTAFTDSAGRPLDGHCDYRIAGTAPPARWWSLTLYGADNYLVPNAAHRYSWSGRTLGVATGVAFEIAVSARDAGAHWLPAPARGHYSLTLRLYRPAPSVQARPAATVLPRITREHCA